MSPTWRMPFMLMMSRTRREAAEPAFVSSSSPSALLTTRAAPATPRSLSLLRPNSTLTDAVLRRRQMCACSRRAWHATISGHSR
uniref:Uncharacterized protein n=1 Tax=Human herpesvirus 2 TaxID=10310 RepID=A0A481TX65_HHV2|nr:hypothetical protein [Human alphaherpesvirus 2]QBH78350.1 hypothetical protein [Human alphaherpesvirus 2]QBH78471.1 hypothetical protein [Human alphaherpesvirus 2]QBH82893.1 hypothetical protein [Human alphaherpesvirus 2]QBH85262.1 hypothetical protein [Human alphaherpesvirus 2]